MRDYLAPHIVMLEMVARRAEEFDIVHLHVDYLGYPIMRRAGVPFVTTLHGRLDLPELQRVYEIFDDVPVVSISDAQRAPLPQANYIATVQHGIPERLLRPDFSAGSYLAFLGRISPEKAPDAAIRIAAKAGMQLKIAAKVDQGRPAVFRRTASSLCLHAPHVEFIGEIDDEQKAEFLGDAAALLFPIAWREPFGLAMIEAMACGTPVIAFRQGSVPEIIDDGITGFIVDNEEQAVGAPNACTSWIAVRIRRVFEDCFTARRMAKDYLDIYRGLIARHRPLRQAVCRWNVAPPRKAVRLRWIPSHHFVLPPLPWRRTMVSVCSNMATASRCSTHSATPKPRVAARDCFSRIRGIYPGC